MSLKEREREVKAQLYINSNNTSTACDTLNDGLSSMTSFSSLNLAQRQLVFNNKLAPNFRSGSAIHELQNSK